MTIFDVHLYSPARAKFCGIEAPSKIEAVRAALARPMTEADEYEDDEGPVTDAMVDELDAAGDAIGDGDNFDIIHGPGEPEIRPAINNTPACYRKTAPANLARALDLLDEYGRAKFGDEWWPGNAAVWIGDEKGAELAGILDTLDGGAK